MIWLSWRQFRTQAAVGTAALLAIAGYLVFLGVQIRDAHDSYLAQCQHRDTCLEVMSRFTGEYRTLLLILNVLVLVVPAVLGLFWGAPLAAREIETGTHRLVWNQSVTRRRWLAAKLLFVGAATVLVTGVISTLLTWAASPVDEVAGDRFSTLAFAARNIVPVAYATFAFVLGTVAGLVLRRTVPAMAVTLLALVVVQVVLPNVVRPHLFTPLTVARPMPAVEIERLTGGLRPENVVKGLTIPDAWVTSTSAFRTADGRTLDDRRYAECTLGTTEPAATCLGRLDLHVTVSYHPNDRYWPFQWIESALLLALSLALAGYGMWRIQRRPT